MPNKTFYIEQTPKLKKYLELIFKNAQITNDLKNNEQLQNALEECLHILNTFEIQLKAKKNSAIEFADKFNIETKKDIKLRELDYQDEYEYVDQINWLVVYCKNQYHIDLMNHSSHVESSNEIIEQTPAQQKRDQIISEAIGADVDASKIIELNNRMINSSKQLTQDIAAGKIYIYKSKPAIMPIINLLFMYSFAILSIFAFLSSLMYFIAAGMKLDQYDSTNSYVFSWANGLVLFVFSGFMIYTSVKSFIFWYKKKNINARYYMN
jgi:ABC-type multidrug transport system fused ATPase/permease subunit